MFKRSQVQISAQRRDILRFFIVFPQSLQAKVRIVSQITS
jgi:hypothetical protein